MEQLRRDNWQVIDELDNWLYIFDRMPPRMKIIVDFRVQGLCIAEIAVILRVSQNNVRAQISKAKKKLLPVS